MSHDTLLHRAVRPGVRAIASTAVMPNQITTARLLTAVAAAIAFALGGVLWPAVGGGVFVFSMLLDRADGELARQSGRSSPAGHRYDVLLDCAANVLAVLGIGLGQAPALGQHRSTQRKAPGTADDEAALTADITALAKRFGRYGYRRITALLRAEGWRCNHKRVERTWRAEGLKVPRRQPKCRGGSPSAGGCG